MFVSTRGSVGWAMKVLARSLHCLRDCMPTREIKMGRWWLTRKRSYLFAAGYAMFAALLFTAFVTTTFPYADTLSALLEPMNLRLVCQRQDMRLPFGARLQNVQLISTTNQQSMLQSSSVMLTPSIMWFILGRPCLKISARVFGGVMDVSLRRGTESTFIDFKLDSLDLALMNRDWPNLWILTAGTQEDGATDTSGFAIGGELSARGSAQIMRQDITRSSGGILLVGHNIKAVLVNGLPPVELGATRAKLVLDQGLAMLQEVKAYGPDGDLAANGRVQLAQDIAHSLVQITFSLKPSARAKSAFGLFFRMLPHDPNDGPFYLQGLLGSLSLS